MADAICCFARASSIFTPRFIQLAFAQTFTALGLIIEQTPLVCKGTNAKAQKAHNQSARTTKEQLKNS